LARNPAAPPDVLLSLLDAAPSPACQGLKDRRDLPRPVQEAMLRHPLQMVRGTLAAHPRVDTDLRNRLLTDPDWQVTVRAFGGPGQQPLSDEVLIPLLTRIQEPGPGSMFTTEELLGELLDAMGWDLRPHRLGVAHPDPRVRRRVGEVASLLDESSRATLLADPVPDIRAVTAAAIAEGERPMRPADLPSHYCHAFWAVLQRPLSRALVDQVVASDDTEALYFVGPNPTTPPDVVRALLRHPSTQVRRQLAARADLSRDQLLELAADPEVEVRTAVSVHPGLTEQDRAGIDIDVTTADGDGHFGPVRSCLHGCYGRVPPLTDALRWAGSVNPLLRRRAARNPELPAYLVAVLADDPDLGVRVLLAQHHPGAPPALLLRCFLEYHRCGRERLSALPQFPTDGLAAFANHPDPVVRRLVALDPHADPALVERLCADPDPGVRQAMAACPLLPTLRITALLDDPELAEHTAANPALPVDRMRQLCGTPSTGDDCDMTASLAGLRPPSTDDTCR
jgi:hypothetical protein